MAALSTIGLLSLVFCGFTGTTAEPETAGPTIPPEKEYCEIQDELKVGGTEEEQRGLVHRLIELELEFKVQGILVEEIECATAEPTMMETEVTTEFTTVASTEVTSEATTELSTADTTELVTEVTTPEGHCVDTNSCAGHYTCDPETGENVCNEGFTGLDCKDRDFHHGIDPECPDDGNVCKNGGTCFNQTCCCLPGFGDVLCNTDCNEACGCGSESDLFQCLNGGICLDEVNAYSCLCLEGFIGVNCESMEETAEPETAGPTMPPEEEYCELLQEAVDAFLGGEKDLYVRLLELLLESGFVSGVSGLNCILMETESEEAGPAKLPKKKKVPTATLR